MSEDSKNYMDLNDFANSGFLQEINRLVLHPCGLALELTLETDDETQETIPGQTECVVRIWDYRDDPEGIIFARDPSRMKATSVDEERRKHYATRFDMFKNLDHKDESYSTHVLEAEKFKGRGAMLKLCHPPDVQPTSDERSPVGRDKESQD